MRVRLLRTVALLAAGFLSAAPAAGQAGDGAACGLPGPRITTSQAAVLGVVEGLTEYLPVSSTGHLILTAHWMGLGGRGPAGSAIHKDPALDAFEIVIQLGAVLAVLGLYRRRVGQVCMGLAGRSREGLRLFGVLAAAFMPAAIVGVTLEKPVKEYLFSPAPVSMALVAGGALMIVAERIARRRQAPRVRNLEDMAWRHGLVIGLAQCIALWPGVSRSMITIVAGLLIGLDIIAAAEFSFLLALPTLGAATIFEGVGKWSVLMDSAGPAGLLVGLGVSGVVAALAVKGFVRWLTGHGLWPFGVYRIALGVAVLLLLGS